MATILNKKVAGFGISDLAIIGISKFTGEMVLNRFVGDANLKSGTVKFILAGLVSKMNRNVAIGVALDGIEDVIIGTGIRNAIVSGVVGENEIEGW